MAKLNRDAKKSYDDGYVTGKNWKDCWIPGGPFSCDEETRNCNRVWLEGFHDGLEVCLYKNSDAIKNLLTNTPN